MRDIQLVELLKAGAHFGHQRSRWHPKMAPFIFTVRNDICIIDLEQTAARLNAAATYAREVTARGGMILFIGTKRQARDPVREAAQRVGAPSVTERWLGGTFTNFATVSKIITKLTQLKSDRDAGRFDIYTKKERLVIQREIDRLEKIIGGIEGIQKLPDAVYVVDVKHERTAVREAQSVGVPIIAMCDTNVNPSGVAYPIPANDDATKSIQLITDVIADAVAEGRTAAQKAAEAAAVVAAEQAAAVAPQEADAAVTQETPA